MPLALLVLAAAEPAARIAALDRRIAAEQARLADLRRPLDDLAAATAAAGLAPPWQKSLDPAAAADLAHARALYAGRAAEAGAQAAPLLDALARDRRERDRLVTALRAAEAEKAARAAARDQAAVARLASLPSPPPRPGTLPVPRTAPAYRLPAAGRVLSGTGERLETGVAARGLTLATAPAAMVTAPALGRVAYAGKFGGYGRIVILDHGHGWTTLLAGLDRATARAGRLVAAGARIGTMPAADPRLTIELRHAGRPVDAAAMAAGS